MKNPAIEVPPHLDYAAASDDTAIVIVQDGTIILNVLRSEAGEEKFNRVLDALLNQQSLRSLKLIAAS